MAQLLGFIYMIFLMMSNFGKNTKQILSMQTISFFFKTLHYYLLGGISGFLTSLISMIRNIIFYKIKTNKIWTIVFIIIYLIIGILTFKTIYTLLPVFATITYTLIINYGNPKYLRYGMIITSISWLIYNIYIISYSGIILQALTLLTSIIAIIKLDKKKDIPYNINKERWEKCYKKN